MLFIRRHQRPKPGPLSRAHLGPEPGSAGARGRASSLAGRRPGHPNRRCGPEARQPRAPGGEGPRGPARSPARRPPPGGSSRQAPRESRVHPRRRRPVARSQCAPRPAWGRLAQLCGRHPAWLPRGAGSRLPGLATPSGVQLPTCKAERARSVKGAWGSVLALPGQR